MKQTLTLFAFILLIAISSCNTEKSAKFETTESGIEYKIVETTEDARVPEYKEILELSNLGLGCQRISNELRAKYKISNSSIYRFLKDNK